MGEISRRKFLKGTAASVLLAASGCNPFEQNNFEILPTTYRKDGSAREKWAPDPSTKISIVKQTTYAIAKDGLLLTPYSESCVVITLYSQKSKLTLMAHTDLLTDPYASVPLMIKELGKQEDQSSLKTVEARIIGGTKGWSEELLKGLVNEIRKADIELVEYDVLNPGYESIIIDSNTGETYNFSQWPDPSDTNNYHDAINYGPQTIRDQIVPITLKKLVERR